MNELREVLFALDAEMAEPLWPALIESPIAIDYTINNITEGEHETIIWSN